MSQDNLLYSALKELLAEVKAMGFIPKRVPSITVAEQALTHYDTVQGEEAIRQVTNSDWIAGMYDNGYMAAVCGIVSGDNSDAEKKLKFIKIIADRFEKDRCKWLKESPKPSTIQQEVKKSDPKYGEPGFMNHNSCS